MRNFLLMTIIQVSLVFNYNLLCFLIPLFEQAYLIGILTSVSEMAAYIFSGVLFECLGVRFTFFVSLLLALVGGLLILYHGLDHQDSLSFPIFFLMAKFGVSSAYNIMIVGNSRVFDVKRAATAFGSASFFARLIQSGSPLLSTMPQPLPMQIFCATIAITAFVTLFIKVAHTPQTKRQLKQK